MASRFEPSAVAILVRAIPVVILLTLLQSPLAAQSSVIFTTGKSALDGSAYSSTQQDFLGGQCVTGTLKPTGVSESSFDLSQTVSESQLSTELGFGMGARARYGVVEASLAANFLSRSVSNAFSVSAIYSAHYNMQPDKMVGKTLELTSTGNAAKAGGNFEHWNETCGDSFVDEIRRGAKLFISIRVDFSSQSQKQEFSSKFSISGPMAGVDASLSTASQSFGSTTKVTVSAYQLGGDTTKVSKIFGDSDIGRQAYVQCSLGHFDDCSTVIKNAIAYASDTNTGFPSQLTKDSEPGPAVVAYGVSSYKAYGIYSVEYPFLAASVELARDQLGTYFERTYRQYVTANRLLDTKLSPGKQVAVQNALEQVKVNLATILKASKLCYDTPEGCPDTVNKLQLAQVDSGALLPDTFSTLCKQSLALGADNPLRVTVMALVNVVDRGGQPADAEDCGIYETLLNRVRTLSLNGQKLSDLSPLAGLGTLEWLSINNNEIVDISSLTDLRNLVVLEADNNKIADLSSLQHLEELESISLSSNRIKDAKALGSLGRLRFANLPNNQIEDVTPFAALPRLVFLDLSKNDVKDVTAFKSPLRLGCVNLKDTLVADDQMKALRTRFSQTVIVGKGGYAYFRPYEYSCKIK